MESIVGQTALNSLVVQVSIYDDASRDRTWELVQKWKTRIEPIKNISLVASKNSTPHPKGGMVGDTAIRPRVKELRRGLSVGRALGHEQPSRYQPSG
uniref:Uncharacterized protein n=1 Tax=Timema douglasi TaxID=61478 RepID=A0A7R8VH91_TIMDO|nr:unnamed protein product [Timema douglasi]